MTKNGRIHIRIDQKVVDRMKRYVRRNHTTVSALVEQYFVRLLYEETLSRDAEQV